MSGLIKTEENWKLFIEKLTKMQDSKSQKTLLDDMSDPYKLIENTDEFFNEIMPELNLNQSCIRKITEFMVYFNIVKNVIEFD